MMNRTLAQVIILCMIGASLSACTSTRPNETSNNPRMPDFKTAGVQDKSKAILYIYRPYRFGSALAAPLIFINNKKIVILRNQRHIWLSLDPGDYVIETRLNSDWAYGNQEVYSLRAESGQSYFLRVCAETTFNPILFPPIGTDFPMIAVKDSEALAELNETHYLEPERKQLP